MLTQTVWLQLQRNYGIMSILHCCTIIQLAEMLEINDSSTVGMIVLLLSVDTKSCWGGWEQWASLKAQWALLNISQREQRSKHGSERLFSVSILTVDPRSDTNCTRGNICPLCSMWRRRSWTIHRDVNAKPGSAGVSLVLRVRHVVSAVVPFTCRGLSRGLAAQ